MQPERVVEIRQGRSSLGTGYIIAPRHVLTARHVVELGSNRGRFQVWPLGAVGDDARPLTERLRPARRTARVAWRSCKRDFAVLVIEGDGFTGISNSTVAFGCVPDDGLSYPCLSAGLPKASRDQEHRIEGSMNWARPELRFDINVGNGVPRSAAAWAGFSGAAVFSGGLLVAVICTVDSSWKGEVLEATPVQFLLDDKDDFGRWCGEAGFTPPVRLTIARHNVSLLCSVSAQLHLLNRHPQVEEIEGRMRRIGDNQSTEPMIFVIPGVDEDEHRHLITRLASEEAIKRRLGRDAPPERVIAPLTWPSEWEPQNPEALLRTRLAAELWRLIAPPDSTDPPVDHPAKWPAEWRRYFEQDTSTRAFWIMLRRATAGPGHAALLRAWLGLWHQLGIGRLVVLFLCVAWDDPPPPRASVIHDFFRPRRLPDPKFAEALIDIIKRRPDGVISELEEIVPADVTQWVHKIRPNCGYAAPEQVDGLRSRLLHFVGAGKRLRAIDRYLGELLQFEKAGAIQGGAM